MRKITQTWDPSNSDLYQWWRGSKLCVGPCESIVTFEEEEQSCIEIRVRGPRGSSTQCFGLFSVILDAVNATLDLVAPGMLLEKHWLSPSQLQGYSDVGSSNYIYFACYINLGVIYFFYDIIGNTFLGTCNNSVGLNR